MFKDQDTNAPPIDIIQHLEHHGVMPTAIANYKNILIDIIKIVQDKDETTAIWLHGSRAVNTYYEGSDLDITIIVENDNVIHYLKSELAKIITYIPQFVEYFLDEPSEHWQCDAGELGINIYTENDFNLFVDTTCLSPEQLDANQDKAQHTVMEAVAIFDKISIIERSQNKIRNAIESYSYDLANLYLRRLKQKVIWWNIRYKWKTPFEQLSDLSVIVEEIAKCHYLGNKRLAMKGLKQYTQDLESLSPNILPEMPDLIQLNYNSDLTNTVRNAARLIITKLENHLTTYNR